jgi:hypothetical protein
VRLRYRRENITMRQYNKLSLNLSLAKGERLVVISNGHLQFCLFFPLLLSKRRGQGDEFAVLAAISNLISIPPMRQPLPGPLLRREGAEQKSQSLRLPAEGGEPACRRQVLDEPLQVRKFGSSEVRKFKPGG